MSNYMNGEELGEVFLAVQTKIPRLSLPISMNNTLRIRHQSILSPK